MKGNYLSSMETLDLDLTENNELTFRVQIEGADGSPANIRMVCEGSDVSYMFRARATQSVDEFDFIVPAMKNRIREGIYRGRIEVMVEGKFFAPVEFDMAFKEPVKVVAEAISLARELPKAEPKVTITAAPVKARVSSSEPPVAAKPAAAPGALRRRYEAKK